MDGLNGCQGRLEIMPSTSIAFGQACDLDAFDNEAQVICRQLGCQATGARRVDPITYVCMNSSHSESTVPQLSFGTYFHERQTKIVNPRL